MPIKKPAFKDYKINEKSPAIRLRMEAMDISRKEAIKVIKELSYRVDYPKIKKGSSV